MALAMTATIGGTNNERCTLAITGAAAFTNKYTSDFSSGVNSWSGGTDGAHLAPDASRALTAYWKRLAAAANGTYPNWYSGLRYSDQYLKRTITGLTIGHTYEARANAYFSDTVNGGQAVLYLAVGGIGSGEHIAVSPSLSVPTALPPYQFTATATSHELRIRRADNWSGIGSSDEYLFDSITVDDIPGTDVIQIQRTDANGTRLVRLNDGAAPDASGNMTVYDEEFSIVSQQITYVFRDRDGSTKSATVTPGAYDYNLLSAPGYLGAVTRIDRLDDYDETREFGKAAEVLSVIGREDPLTVSRTDFAWSKRKGRLTFYARDYEEAESSIVARFTDGRVFMLRQPTHTPLDLYGIASQVDSRPLFMSPDGWRWQVVVSYQEIDWPEGDLKGSQVWTYADLADSYLAYWNLPDVFDTYADLAAGP